MKEKRNEGNQGEVKRKMGNSRLFCLVLATLLGVGKSLETASCPRPVNILFLLKSSKNIDSKILRTAKQFIKQTADSYQVIPGKIDMALILMGPNTSVVAQFGQNDTNYFKEEVDKLGLSKEETFIVSYEGIFDRAIPYAARAVVVMTTGDDDETNSLSFKQAIKDIKESKASHVLAIQLTEGQDLRRLLAIATDYDLIFNVKELIGNRKQQDKFYLRICSSLGDIRLNGKSLNRGCVEVYKNRTWSPVCSPTWNNRLADLICHRLGFSVNASVGNDSESVLSFLSNETCGRENSSIEYGCKKVGIYGYRNCSHRLSCLQIVCQVPVRLSGSPSRPHIGLLEVLFLGTWGTVCSDTFVKHGADIVCQNLGYPHNSLVTFVDLSNNISSLPAMLMSIDCAVETGSLEQNCTLTRCDRKCTTSCTTRPASVLCDTNQKEATEATAITRNIGPKITISCNTNKVKGVKWYYENGHERREIALNNDLRIKFTNKDAKESQLTIRKILLKDSGAYFCESGLSRKMTFLFIKMNYSQVESKQYFIDGKDGILRCNVFGSPPPKLEWRKNGELIGVEKESLWKHALQEDGTLLIRNISVQDVGKYECKFRQNTKGIVNYERKMIELLLYEEPTATIIGSNLTVENGRPTILKCSATGRPKPNITWYKNNTAIPRHKYVVEQVEEQRFHVTKLSIYEVTIRDYGMYTCTAKNNAGSKSAFVWITPPLFDGKQRNNDDKRWPWFATLLVVLFVVGGLGLVIWFIHRKRRKNSDAEKMSELSIISSKSCDIWELPKGSLHLQKIIGKGMFGEVWKAVALNKTKNKDGSQNQQPVAVKKPRDDGSDIQKNMLKQEIAVNKNFSGRKHPNIVNFLGCFTSDDMVMMVIEYVPYGDLLGYLRENRGVKDKFYFHSEELPQQDQITPYELFSFATQIACGMSFLAENKVIHRDLAARNVLVGKNLVCKITDFGLAKVVKDGNGYMGTRKGRLPIKWTAPEVFFGDVTITSQSDVWSYGITLYEIFTIGGDPYPGQGEWDIVYKIRTDKYIMNKPEHISDEIYDVMISCWRKDPKSRPTFEQIHSQLTKMVETNHYLELDMTKYQSHMYANLDDMEEDLLI